MDSIFSNLPISLSLEIATTVSIFLAVWLLIKQNKAQGKLAIQDQKDQLRLNFTGKYLDEIHNIIYEFAQTKDPSQIVHKLNTLIVTNHYNALRSIGNNEMSVYIVFNKQNVVIYDKMRDLVQNNQGNPPSQQSLEEMGKLVNETICFCIAFTQIMLISEREYFFNESEKEKNKVRNAYLQRMLPNGIDIAPYTNILSQK